MKITKHAIVMAMVITIKFMAMVTIVPEPMIFAIRSLQVLVHELKYDLKNLMLQ